MTVRAGDVPAVRQRSVVAADRFCESCGAVLSEIRRVAIPRSAAETSRGRARTAATRRTSTSTAPYAVTGAPNPIATRRTSTRSC